MEGFANLTGILIGAGLLLPVTRILGDLIVIYRCWVLWSKAYWVIILPSLSVISTFGKSYYCNNEPARNPEIADRV